MKVMDYFAAGVPVVTTSKGVEGLGLLDGRELLVRDDWDGFARAIGQILEDRHTADSLVEAGRRYVERLDWSQIARRYIDLYGAISRA